MSWLPKRRRHRIYPVSLRQEGDIYHATAGPRSIWIASEQRKTLYRNGIRARLDRLARTYGALDLAKQFRDKVVLDIGANIGEFSLFARRHKAHVYAFEPDPAAFQALKRNTERKGVQCFDTALWNEDAELEFFVETAGANSSLILPKSARNTIKVQALTLETFLDRHGIDEVFFLKADVEGGEPEMLEGASNALRRVRYLSVDCGPERRGETTVEAASAILRGAGFRIRQLSQKRCVLFGERQ